MHKYVFAILKCRKLKKNRKNKKYCGVFAVCMHTAKDHLVTLPCAYTWQRLYVALTCASGGWMVCQPGSLPCVLVHGARQRGSYHARQRARTAMRTTHGSVRRHGNENNARQRPPAWQRKQRTAASLRCARQRAGTHGREAWHGKTPGTHGNVSTARQSSLPSLLRETHGKVFVAGHYFGAFAVRYARTAKHCSPVVSAPPRRRSIGRWRAVRPSPVTRFTF
jgi:hypothetical protein